MIHNPLGYLATYRRALREGSEIRQKLAAELIERNESLNADNVDQLLGVMEMDKEKFVYYGERYGLAEAGNLEDMATAFFKDEKERDRAWWRKREELEDRAVMPHPEGAQYRIWTANITESLTEKAHAKRLGGDLDEAISLFQEKTGLMIQIGAQYDRDAAHKELSWLANMMDASPDLDACYRKAFKSIRFHNTQSGTAAMQVGGSQVSVYPTLHTANMWYHEAGHGLQTLAEQGGKLSFEQDLKPHFGQGPMPSRYALGNYSEDFAECWVHLGGGHAEALEAWAPRKAAIVRRAMEVLR